MITKNKTRRPIEVTALCLAPALLCMLAFFVAPIAKMAAISVFQYSSTEIWIPDFSLENYAQFFSSFYVNAMFRTLYIALLVTAVCALLGYPYAYFLARAPAHRIGIYLFALIAPLMMSSVVLILGWVMILGNQGPVVRLLSLLGIGNLKILYSKPAVVIGLTELLLPFMVLSLKSAIEKVPLSVEEASRILGAGRISMFFRVVLPLTRTGLVSGSLLVFTMAIGSLVAPALLGSSRDVMLGNVIYEAVLTSLNWPFAAAVSFLLLAMTLVLMSIYLRVVRPMHEVSS